MTFSINLLCQPSSAINQLRTSLSFLVDEQGDNGQEGSTEQLSGKFADGGVPVISIPAFIAYGGGTAHEPYTVGIGRECDCGGHSVVNGITTASINTLLGRVPRGIVTVGDDGTGTGIGRSCTLSFVAKLAGTGISGTSIRGLTYGLHTVSNGSACSWPGCAGNSDDRRSGSFDDGVTGITLQTSPCGSDSGNRQTCVVDFAAGDCGQGIGTCVSSHISGTDSS